MTSISTNVYIDILDNTVNKYNNTYHRTIKMKPVDGSSIIYIDFNRENNELVIMLEYQNIKIFLQNVTLQIVLKKFL